MAKADCKFCGGTGWIIGATDGISEARKCDCRAQQRAEELEGRAQIPSNYANSSFDSIVAAGRTLNTAIFQVKGYTDNFAAGRERNGLILVGPPGVGKTHLAVAALRALLARGYEGIFFDYQNLLERIYASYSEALKGSNREAYRVALDTEVLLLDDLGASSINDWVEDTISAIITYRCNNKKPLIATTNLSDPDMGGPAAKLTLTERIGERARSRLFEMCRVINMWGVPDYRIFRSRAPEVRS